MAANNRDWHRNLSKVDLGGVILDCSTDNMRKILSSKLFGLPSERIVYVKNIEKGLPLFLFNTDDRKLRGVYEAASLGEYHIALDEWTGEQYPARVQIRAHPAYTPLTVVHENQFKDIIAANYYSEKDFKFELDQYQTTKLKKLYTDSGLALLKRQLDREKKEKEDKKRSIYIVGGYDWGHSTSTLYSFSPSDDTLKTLKPMSFPRRFASVAEFNRELCVLGGCAGSKFYEEVESYNPRNNCWTPLPSLVESRASLAAAALNGKLFAIGGQNQDGVFRAVEMFDPEDDRRWTRAPSMLESRCGLAAVEFDGAIYAVGGCDGTTILKSAERYDPREGSWRKIGSMQAERLNHSLVVLNEKLYAIGGCDESAILRSVEIYDPHLDIWLDGKPMNQGRYRSVAAVLNESIFVIGGIKSGSGEIDPGDVSDVIECYKEGQGWEVTNLKAVGRNCWFSSGTVLAEENHVDEEMKTSTRRRRGNEEEALRPIEENPAELLQAVGRVNGTTPIFLYGKKLEESDVRQNQNRLFVNYPEKIIEFLGVEDLTPGIVVEAIDVQGNTYIMEVKEWRSLRQMVLKKEWYKLIVNNDAETGHWVQVWGFRLELGDSCFAFSFVKPGSTSASGICNNNGEGTSKVHS